MEAAAIPGVAVPLLQDDCIDTTVDLDWVWDYIHLTSDDQTRRLDLGALRDEVDFWFTPLNRSTRSWAPPRARPRRSRREWLGRAGKRWRPFLTVAAYQALRDDAGRAAARGPAQGRRRRRVLSQGVAHSRRHRGQRRAALRREDAARRARRRRRAECRRPAHRRRLPPARRVPASAPSRKPRCSASPPKASANSAAARARNLLGAQARSRSRTLAGARHFPQEDRARLRSRAAARRALRRAELHDEVDDVLSAYSEALGIAYQIRDDLSDLGAERRDQRHRRPAPEPAARHRLRARRRTRTGANARRRALAHAACRHGAHRRRRDRSALPRTRRPTSAAATCSNATRKKPSARLRDLENANLKGLLRRVIGKIFNDTEIKGWCKEFEQKNLAKTAREAVSA